MNEVSLDIDHLSAWVGNTERSESFIDQRSVNQMQSIVGLKVTPMLGEPLPNLWHWMYTFPVVPLDALNYDGHPKLGDFLPPVALPRRMWAGGRLTFKQPLLVGSTMSCLSTVKSVSVKNGRSGALCFVTVEHQFSSDGEVCIEEEHDIVYRDNPVKGVAVPLSAKPTHTAQWSQTVTPDPVILFRYSAATFNGHRIHYDRDFCRSEDYPGLVFHGPLTATLLMKLLQEQNPGKTVSSFKFKALSPLFDTVAFTLNGCDNEANAGVCCWASNPEGRLAISAEATFV